MNRLPWFLNGYFLKQHTHDVCKIYSAVSLEDARRLQQKYPSEFIALPAHTSWHDVEDAEYLDYSKLCATNIYSLPYRSMEILWNTPVKCMLLADFLYEFDKSKKEIIRHEAVVLS